MWCDRCGKNHETARDELWHWVREGLSEWGHDGGEGDLTPDQVIDGFAHELAELQRLRMDELDLTGQKARIVGRIADLIDPHKSAGPARPDEETTT